MECIGCVCYEQKGGGKSSVAAYNIVVPLFGINTHLKCKQLK